MKYMNIANYFTFLRIVLIPLFPIFYLGYGNLGISFQLLPYILLVILVICEFSDVADGFLARKNNQVTDFGKIIDPMADTITNVSVFFTFTQGAVAAPLLLILIFLYREFFISTLRTFCALKGVVLAARKTGKIKTVIQAAVNFLIVLLMIPYSLGYLSLEWLRFGSLWLLLIAACYSVYSAIDYILANRQLLKKYFIN